MIKFIKLFIFAFIYAFVFFIQTELMLNVNRLERLYNWANKTSIFFIIIVIFIISTALFIILTLRYINYGLLRYLLSILWIPVYLLLVFLFSFLAPMSNKADEPSNALGIILIVMFFCYPFYIAFINLICAKQT